MKSTGIVRRIDELGRIVIPKEIRKNLKINETDNIEIYVENDAVILKKYSFIRAIHDFSGILTESIYHNIKKTTIITDTTNIIACSGNIKNKIINENISDDLANSIKRRENLFEKHKKCFFITDKYKTECSYLIKSILNAGDVVGLFIIIDDNALSEQDLLIADIVTRFLGNYLEK